jgi:hypothetical protein
MVLRNHEMIRYLEITPEIRANLIPARKEFLEKLGLATTLISPTTPTPITIPRYTTTLTSELVYHSKSLNDLCAQEYERRLRQIDIPDELIKDIYQLEKTSLELKTPSDFKRDQPWAQKRFCPEDVHFDETPHPNYLTLSELVSITDELYSDSLMKDTGPLRTLWQGLCYAENPSGEKRPNLECYSQTFNERIERLGLSDAQARAYAVNELLVIGKSGDFQHNPVWEDRTTNLEKYMD